MKDLCRLHGRCMGTSQVNNDAKNYLITANVCCFSKTTRGTDYCLMDRPHPPKRPNDRNYPGRERGTMVQGRYV